MNHDYTHCADYYISRQAAINIVCHDECDDCPDGGCDMYRRLKHLPAADVVEVVRCKDCMHWKDDLDYCDVWEHFISNRAFFCACGRRRTE